MVEERETLVTGKAEPACDIAIVGMACRFPGASNIDEFWRKLAEGAELITFLSGDELLAAGVDPRLLDDPTFVKADGALDGIELFDAGFFGFTPKEAELMDPQVRLFLEVAWEALENASYSWDMKSARVGVYAGASLNSYLLSNLYPNSGLIDSVGAFQTTILNNRDYLPLHVSYRLNLRGPSINVQTACSTSLTAVHLACQSLLGRESDIAIAGGSSIRVPQRRGYLFEEGGILSPDGHCRAFDERAAGTVASSGVGAVVLKRLEDAIEHRDFIHAVIRGTAANNDGSAKAGFTAPAIDGQAAVIEEALAMAAVSPETVSYIEAHGTGTALGDPIEIAALTQVFRRYTNASSFCRIGSVKTNLGHLDAAAGVAGLIKTALALQHRKMPPSLNFEKPNSRIEFENSPFVVNASLCDWEAAGFPRRAGVSSFGIGGTNVHVVLEEAPPRGEGNAAAGSRLLPLSARTPDALDAVSRNLAAFISSHPDVDLSDVAFTLQTGRKGLVCRRAIVCGSAGGGVDLLLDAGVLAKPQSRGERKDGRVFNGSYDGGRRPVAFVFPGQGSQYAGMGRGIYDLYPVFRREIDRCIDCFDPDTARRLRFALFAGTGEREEADPILQQTGMAQPALFAVSYALARQLMTWGINPDSMIGHSIGEFVAACIAEVMSLEDALRLVALRGRLMDQLPAGPMLAVPLDEEGALRVVDGLRGLSVAAVNGPKLSVVSGPFESMRRLEEALSADGVSFKQLRVSHSFHSEIMDPILDEFADAVAGVQLHSPRIPYISNVTGAWITNKQATSPRYYARHLRETVRFYQGIRELKAEPDRIFVEVGPRGGLEAAVGNSGSGQDAQRLVVDTLGSQSVSPDEVDLNTTLARLWVAGVSIGWAAVHEGEIRNLVPLPTYPFERQRYWIEPPEASELVKTPDRREPETAKWFYEQCWKRAPLAMTSSTPVRNALLFADGAGICENVARVFESREVECVFVRPSERFEKSSESEYDINPLDQADYARLLRELQSSGKAPSLILHCWNESLLSAAQTASAADPSLPIGYRSLIYLAQALGERAGTRPIEILAITNGVQDVIGVEAVNPAAAVGLGPCKVIPIEYPNLKCRSIDIATADRADDVSAALAVEAMSGSRDRMVAYRNGLRWTAEIEPLGIDPDVLVPPVIRPEGAYLITGGMGEIEFQLATHLVELGARNLIITGLPVLSNGDSWHDYELQAVPQSQPEITERLEQLSQLGINVFCDSADAGDYEGIKTALKLAYKRFGRINGAIHTAFRVAGGMIQFSGPETSRSVFASRISPALAIDEIAKDDPLDFLVLFSTTVSVTGVFGQADYCGANAYLDSFAARRRAGSGRAVAINWDVTSWERWQESALTSVPELQSQLRELRERFGVTPQEAVRCLDIALALGRHQVIVSTRDFLQVVKSQSDSAADGFLSEVASIVRTTPGSEHGATSESYIPPAGEIEEGIASIWCDTFGVQRIAADADFFSIGGNSLVAIQVISRLRKQFDVEMPMSALFEHPTIASLGAFILAAQSEAEGALEMEKLLAEIEGLTPEEVNAALAQEASEELPGGHNG